MNSLSYDYKLFVTTRQKGMVNELLFHTHSYYEIYLFHAGSCKYMIDNRIYDLQPGDVIVMDGKSLHKPFISGEPNNYVRSIVQFSVEWIRPLMEFLQCDYLLAPFETNHHSIYRTNNDASFHQLTSNIALMEERVKEDLSTVENELRVKLNDILYTLNRLEKYRLVDSDFHNENHLYVERVTNYIQQHFDQKLMLDDIAGEINLSKSHMVRLFKAQTGFTIMEYLMHFRLVQFLHLASIYPQLSIKALCSKCGFESESHFSRFFKKKVGVTPKEYRNGLRRFE